MRRTLWRGLVSLLLVHGVSAVAQDTPTPAPPQNPVHVRIYNADSSAYPEIKVYFSVLNRLNGRMLPIMPDNLQATLGDGSTTPTFISIERLENQANTNRRLNLVLCFDLTASNTNDFLDKQKKTALDLIGNLDPNDAVAIVTQSDQGANVVFPLKADHDGALSAIDLLEIVRGRSNHFYDGVSVAVNVLSSVTDTTSRSAVIVMTDVQDPQGGALPTQTIQLANTLNTPLYMIGYNDARREVLDQFANTTNGFTYLQREMDDNFDRLTQDMTEFLKHEYVLTLHSALPALDTAYHLTLTVDMNGSQFRVDGPEVKGTARPLIVKFPRISEGEIFTGEIRFEPQITYADGRPARDVQATYTLERGPLIRSTTALGTGSGQDDPTFIWALADKVGGDYDVKISVVDAYGNRGEQQVHFVVHSPLMLQFVNPSVPDMGLTTATYVAASDTRLLIRVDSSYGVSHILLHLNGQDLGNPVPVQSAAATIDATVEATAQVAPDQAGTAQLYEYVWDTSGLAPGAYIIDVEAKDMRGNTNVKELPIEILLGNQDPFNILIFAALILVFILMLSALTLVRRATQKNVPLPVIPPAPPRPRATLSVIANGVPGRKEYVLWEKNYIVGRGDAVDIQVLGLTASRTHAELRWDGTDFTWMELTPEKKNSAIINTYPVNRQQILQHMDQIQLGDTVFQFRVQFPHL